MPALVINTFKETIDREGAQYWNYALGLTGHGNSIDEAICRLALIRPPFL